MHEKRVSHPNSNLRSVFNYHDYFSKSLTLQAHDTLQSAKKQPPWRSVRTCTHIKIYSPLKLCKLPFRRRLSQHVGDGTRHAQATSKLTYDTVEVFYVFLMFVSYIAKS